VVAGSRGDTPILGIFDGVRGVRGGLGDGLPFTFVDGIGRALALAKQAAGGLSA
jgi:hypothetical protein